MNEMDRWIYLDGPVPDELRPVIEALRADVPIEEKADPERMKRGLLARFAAMRRGASLAESAAAAREAEEPGLRTTLRRPSLYQASGTDANPRLQPGDPGYCATKGYGATLNGDKATLIASGDPYGLWYFQLERRYASLDAPPAQLTVDWTNGTTSATGTPIPYCPSTLFDFPSGTGVWSTYDAGTGPVTPPTTYVAPSFSYTTSGPQPPVLKAGAYASLPDGFATTGTKDYVCSYGQSTELVNDGTTSYIRVIDDLYVVGDILVGTKR